MPNIPDDLLRDAGEEPGRTPGSAEGDGDPPRPGPVEEPGHTRTRAEGEPNEEPPRRPDR